MKKTRIALIVFLLFGVIILALSRLIPAPIEGYWHSEFTDCLCDSKNLLAFKEGKIIRYATGHEKHPLLIGNYRWDREREYIENDYSTFVFKPGWFRLTIKEHPESDAVYKGWREWRPSYVSAVLDHFKGKEPVEPAGTGQPM